MQKIDIRLKPSRQFISLIALVWVGSAGCMMSLSIPWFLKILFIISGLVYGSRILWVSGLMMSSSSIIGLQLLADGSCSLQYPMHTMAAEVKGDSTVTTALCVLRFSVQGKRWKTSCIIFKDSLEREIYRELLVWLRCLGVGIPCHPREGGDPSKINQEPILQIPPNEKTIQ